MSRMNHENSRIDFPFIGAGLRLGSLECVPADNFVIEDDMPPYLIFAPAGAIDVLLPESTAARKGLCFLVSNNSANAITFKTSADAAFTTAIVLAANETTLLVCTGHATAALGWRAIGTASSA